MIDIERIYEDFNDPHEMKDAWIAADRMSEAHKAGDTIADVVIFNINWALTEPLTDEDFNTVY